MNKKYSDLIFHEFKNPLTKFRFDNNLKYDEKINFFSYVNFRDIFDLLKTHYPLDSYKLMVVLECLSYEESLYEAQNNCKRNWKFELDSSVYTQARDLFQKHMKTMNKLLPDGEVEKISIGNTEHFEYTILLVLISEEDIQNDFIGDHSHLLRHEKIVNRVIQKGIINFN